MIKLQCSNVMLFMDRLGDTSLRPLPHHHVDTEIELERVTVVLQGTTSNFNTDLFKPRFDHIHWLIITLRLHSSGNNHTFRSSSSGNNHTLRTNSSGNNHTVRSNSSGNNHTLRSNSSGNTHTLQSHSSGNNHTVRSNSSGNNHTLRSNSSGNTHTLQSHSSGNNHTLRYDIKLIDWGRAGSNYKIIQSITITLNFSVQLQLHF